MIDDYPRLIRVEQALRRQHLADAAAWSRARAEAIAAFPPAERPGPEEEVSLLVTGQEHAADNGMWWVKGDGSRRRPGSRIPSVCPGCGGNTFVERLRWEAVPPPHGPGGVWCVSHCDRCGEHREGPIEPGPSRRYALTPEAAYNDPLLSALAHTGATEEQVIAALTKKIHDLHAQMLRYAELTAMPTLIVQKGPER